MTQVSTDQLSEFFRNAANTKLLQGCIVAPDGVVLQQLLRDVCSSMWDWLGKVSPEEDGPLRSINLLTLLYQATSDEELIEEARRRAHALSSEGEDHLWQRISAWRVISLASGQEQDLQTIHVLTRSEDLSDYHGLSALADFGLETNNHKSLDLVEKLFKERSESLPEWYRGVASSEIAQMRVRFADSTVTSEQLREHARGIDHLHVFDVLYEIASRTREEEDVESARAAVNPNVPRPQLAKLARLTQDPKDIEVAWEACTGHRAETLDLHATLQGRIDLAVVSGDPEDFEWVWKHLKRDPLDGLYPFSEFIVELRAEVFERLQNSFLEQRPKGFEIRSQVAA